MNVYLTSTVKLNVVKFHSGTSAHTRNMLCNTVDTYLNDIRRQHVR